MHIHHPGQWILQGVLSFGMHGEETSFLVDSYLQPVASELHWLFCRWELRSDTCLAFA